MSTTPSRPLALSDEQMTTIMNTAEPLSPSDRSAFLRDVALTLAYADEIGDGVVRRVCSETFARYFRAPSLARRAGTSKWSR